MYVIVLLENIQGLLIRFASLQIYTKLEKKPSAPGGGAKMIPPPGHQIWPYVTLPLTSDLMTRTVYRFMP